MRFILTLFMIMILPHTPAHANAELMQLYDSQSAASTMDIPNDKPHRNAEQIAEWVEARVTNAMTINPRSFDKKKKGMMADFETYAISEYETYLNSAGLLNTLNNKQLKLNVISSAPPKLISEGALNGTYRWLFDVPLLLSFYPLEMRTLRAASDTTKSTLEPNQRVILRVQVGRLLKPDENRPDGIVIERWSAVN